MTIDSAHAWRAFYAAERDRLGRDHLGALVERAEPLPLRDGGAIVVPHTRIEVTGEQIARAVATVIASGADRVLALGVLHGGRRSDGTDVAAARSGDTDALARLRRVHHADGLAAEEFSLDAFAELLALAAERAGRRVDVLARYPFLVGDDPSSLPGMDELHAVVRAGALIVATTDPMHHGHAYGTAPADCLPADDPVTLDLVRAAIDAQFDALAEHRYDEFATLAQHHRSDFRDTGPVLAELVGRSFDPLVHDLALVDYSEALDAPAPTWVAGALATV